MRTPLQFEQSLFRLSSFQSLASLAVTRIQKEAEELTHLSTNIVNFIQLYQFSISVS